MGRVLLEVLLPLGLTIFAVIDCIQTDESEVRNLPKIVWVLLILFFWVVGPIAWLVAGRPNSASARRDVAWPSTRTAGFPEYEKPARSLAPDDDPEFLAQLRRSNTEHEQMLKRWEDDLRKREEDLRRDGDDPTDSGPQDH